MIVSAWNPADVGSMALPPCHCLFQFYVAKTNCLVNYTKEVLIFFWSSVQYSILFNLTHMIANVTGLSVGDFVHTLGDAHLYMNHFEQTKLQLSRSTKKLPKLKISKSDSDINEFKFEDFEITDYDPYPNIPAPVAV